MKALQNESKSYILIITTAITECYADEKPSNSELMHLYTSIGEQIVLQGEKAFVAHLAEIISNEFANLSGYSLRNLRRMRDFYNTYSGEPKLREQAMLLSWTQNTVIMEYCDSNEKRAFYLQLAREENLSKLNLVAAIENKVYETTLTSENAVETVTTVVAPESDFICEEAHTTEKVYKAQRDPPVAPCTKALHLLVFLPMSSVCFHPRE